MIEPDAYREYLGRMVNDYTIAGAWDRLSNTERAECIAAGEAVANHVLGNVRDLIEYITSTSASEADIKRFARQRGIDLR